MPPRSYYIDPRPSDYVAFAQAYFPNDIELATAFSGTTGRPLVQSVEHLAAYLGISASLIRQILHKKEYHYRCFELVKGDGDVRLISTPKTYLKVIQWWIMDNILNTAEVGTAVHGFTRGRSYVSNAQEHLGANHLLNVDIKKFFPSITTAMVSRVFVELGYETDGANLLAELCTLAEAAPTGAPTSPMLGNLVLKDFDKTMIKLAANYTYTRYADDLTFSSESLIPEEFYHEVQNAVTASGFRLNLQKTKFMGRGDRMEVTGVVINEFPNLPRNWRNWARGFLHRAAQNPNSYRGQWQRISGILGTLKSIDPNEDKPLTKKARSTLELLKPKKLT
jgi:RNA-directed DNA polymerase